MATIQVRDLSEDSYEIYRKRARAAGQSLQAHVRDVLETEAAKTPKAEVLAAMEEALRNNTGSGVTIESILADKDADRR